MRLSFVGDFVVYGKLPTIGTGLKSVLDISDYNIVNFEAPIHTNNVKSKKSGPSISQNKENPKWLEENGFNLISLANNHIFDYGNEGFLKTKKAFGNIPTIGAGTWEEAYKPVILEQDGLKVGVLSMGELQFGYLHDSWTQKDDLGCAWINHPCVNKLVYEIKKHVSFLIVIAHAGLEMVTTPLPEWRDRYRELIDLGCDAIIGGHTHVPQGYELYKGKPIFYSLGNFCFSSLSGFQSEMWNIGEVVSFDISHEGPIFNFWGVENNDGKLELVDETRWNDTAESLNNQLFEDIYLSAVTEVCKKQMQDYWSIFNMSGLIHLDKELPKSVARHILNKYDHIHLVNLFQCESHRWCISRALKLENTAVNE